ncbi:hypothetical protein ACHWQZ_G011867 [Mnemiopsis leidyi]
MKILLAYGIPQNIVRLIEAMYKDTFARVITEDGLTEAYILTGVEPAAHSIGLHLNESKTKYIGVNLSDDDSTIIKAGSGEELEKVDDFVYLGSRIMRTERDFEVSKGKHGEHAKSSKTSGGQGCIET